MYSTINGLLSNSVSNFRLYTNDADEVVAYFNAGGATWVVNYAEPTFGLTAPSEDDLTITSPSGEPWSRYGSLGAFRTASPTLDRDFTHFGLQGTLDRILKAPDGRAVFITTSGAFLYSDNNLFESSPAPMDSWTNIKKIVYHPNEETMWVTNGSAVQKRDYDGNELTLWLDSSAGLSSTEILSNSSLFLSDGNVVIELDQTILSAFGNRIFL